MHTDHRAPAMLDHEQLDRLAVRLADQERFRTQQVAQLSTTRRTSMVHEQIRTTLLAGALEELAATQAARRRLLEGIYGRCESCAALISVERLEALPHVPLCFSCERRCRDGF